ncbi:MAG TPA: hypothetical protein VG591_09725 [Burkholderiales bacterium]|jgi:hypothetical protein|nr:hypothetical protein [Burkholderiales bacterium]
MKKAALLALLVFPAPALADVGVNLYGLSHHFDRARARELKVDNGVNPGLGLRYRIAHSERLEWIFDVGAYRDSGRDTALIAGAGGLWHATSRLRLGAALALFDSDTYNRGRTAIAPLPVAGYELGRATLNVVYLPRVSEINEAGYAGLLGDLVAALSAA